MTALGLVLLVIGVVMVVAEAHAPSGALGIGGGIALIVGGVIAIVSVGGSAAIAVPVGLVLGVGAGAWTLFVRREVTSGPRRRIRAGSEALGGRIGRCARGRVAKARCSSTARCGAPAATGSRTASVRSRSATGSRSSTSSG